MAVVSKLVITHVNGVDNVLIMADGAEFVLVNNDKHTKKFSAADAQAIVTALTGIDIAIKIAKLQAGRSLLAKDRIVTILCEGADLDEVKYQMANIVLNAKVKDTWNMNVMTESEVISFPMGVVDDLLKYLLSQEGIQKAPTAGYYNKILFVNELPTENIDTDAAYVLDKAQGDKPAGSAWVYIDEWIQMIDTEEETEGTNETPAEPAVDPKPADPVVEPTVDPEQP